MRTHHVAEGLPLAEYLEEEERIAQNVQEETFFTWVVAPTVIYGHHQILEQEVNVAYCREHNIDIVQRKSGGGCVYADRGNLMLSFVSPSTHSEEVFLDFLHRVANGLREMGYDAVTTEHNDILVSGHKIAGFACHSLPTGTVVHACMLYEVNLDDLTQAITPTKEKLEKHAVASVRQRVINLRDIKDSGSMEQFRRTLEKHIKC